MDIRDPEVPASVSDPHVNMQGLTSTFYPSQTPEMKKRKFTMLPTVCLPRIASETLVFVQHKIKTICQGTGEKFENL